MTRRSLGFTVKSVQSMVLVGADRARKESRMFKRSLLAALAAAALTLVGRNASAQDYTSSRDRCMANYQVRHGAPLTPALDTVPSGTQASCMQWTALVACHVGLAQNAVPGGALTCSENAQAALEALSGAQRACGTLTGRAADFESQLNDCRTRSATAQPRAPRRVRLPLCLEGPQFGGTVLTCVTTGGVHLTGQACKDAARETLRSAKCECPTGGLPVAVAGTRAQFCVRQTPLGPLNPPAVVEGGSSFETRISTLEGDVDQLEVRLDSLCAHPSGDAENPISTNCAEMNILIQRGWANAANGGAPLDVSGLTSRMDRMELAIREHAAQLVDHEDRIRRLERRARARFFAGFEGGVGPIVDQNLFSLTIGGELRVAFIPMLDFVVGAGLSAGVFDAPQIPVAMGYLGYVGLGLNFNVANGATELHLDAGLGLRGYHDFGAQQTQATAAEIGRFGDFLGFAYGGEVHASMRVYGTFGLRGTLFIGKGDAISGTNIPGEFALVADGLTLTAGLAAVLGF